MHHGFFSLRRHQGGLSGCGCIVVGLAGVLGLALFFLIVLALH